MNPSNESSESYNGQTGLIGFFDILGYSSIIKNNPIEKAISIVKLIRRTIEDTEKRLHESEAFINTNFYSHPIFTFSPDQISDVSQFARKLHQKSDALSAFLWKHADEHTRAILANYQNPSADSEEMKQVIVVILNRVINMPELYEEARFRDLKLRPRTHCLLQRKQEKDDSQRLNRYLLEDGYPRNISRNWHHHEVSGNICRNEVFSDSILVYAPPCESPNFLQLQTSCFVEFCACLTNALLWAGLPVRGALAHGDFYVDRQSGGLGLAGRPIVDAHELSNSLDLSGCVLEPTAKAYLADKKIIDTSFDRPRGFIGYFVPMKQNTGCENEFRFMLDQGQVFKNYRADYHEGPDISHQMVAAMFAAHNKPITDEKIVRKINNTWKFLKASSAI